MVQKRTDVENMLRVGNANLFQILNDLIRIADVSLEHEEIRILQGPARGLQRLLVEVDTDQLKGMLLQKLAPDRLILDDVNHLLQQRAVTTSHVGDIFRLFS
ncbi:hypothetical protein D3C84_720640 [compost metagenome]